MVASILYVICFYFIGSAIKPGYSQMSNFVSEYNATGTPWAGTLTYAGYLVTAILLSAFLVSATPLARVSGMSRVGFWLLWSIPASYFLAVVAPCDAGCPLEGSPSQLMHNFLAVVSYFGMGLAVTFVALAPSFTAFKYRRIFMILLGVAFPVVFIAMLQPAISLVWIAWILIPSGEQAHRGVA